MMNKLDTINCPEITAAHSTGGAAAAEDDQNGLFVASLYDTTRHNSPLAAAADTTRDPDVMSASLCEEGMCPARPSELIATTCLSFRFFSLFVLLRETERLWENWLITKTAFPSPQCDMSCVHLVG